MNDYQYLCVKKFYYWRIEALTSIPQEVLTFQWQEIHIDF
jgi:hypothetical protein